MAGDRVNRQPTLHEYGIFCCKVVLNDHYAIGMPPLLCPPLNADFDGDTVSIQLVPPESAEEAYRLMSPRVSNIYKKTNEPIFVFQHEALNGAAVASQYVYDDISELDDPKEYYTDWNQLVKDVEVDKKFSIGKPIVFTGKVGGVDYKNKVTSYGRLKISKILGQDLDSIGVLKSPYDRLNGGSCAKLSLYLYKQPDGLEKLRDLQKYFYKVVTEAGVVTFDGKTLYVDTDNDTYKKICEVADSPDISDKQKVLLMTELYDQYEKEVEKEYSDDLKKELSMAQRVKLNSITAMAMPVFSISTVDEIPMITRGTLLGGLSEKDYINHAIENRALQALKVKSTPTSGYLNRQLSFLMNNYVYEEGEDPKNPCLMIPRYIAGGRTAPTGKVYSEVKTQDEEDLVPVRSIVTKKDGNLSVVTPDLIGTKYHAMFSPGSAIGLSFSTSLVEAITQASLGLKHGGHERIMDKGGYLKAPRACTLQEEGKWLVLKYKGGELRYPRPENFVGTGQMEFKAGDLVGTAYNTTSPIYRLNALCNLTRASGGNGVLYFEKDNVIISDCFAFEDGEINYKENKYGEIEVWIGSRRYEYNPQCMYFFPQGAKVKKLQRFASGVVNMNRAAQEIGSDISALFMIFRSQFLTLMHPGSYGKKGVAGDNDTQEEIIELLFTALTHVELDPKSLEIDQIEYMGTQNGIMGKKSFYTALSYGYSSRVIGKALKGDLKLDGDVMTETILGLLLNNKLDENLKK